MCDVKCITLTSQTSVSFAFNTQIETCLIIKHVVLYITRDLDYKLQLYTSTICCFKEATKVAWV